MHRNEKTNILSVVLVVVALIVVSAGLITAIYFLTTEFYDKETFLPDDCYSARASVRWEALHSFEAKKPTALEKLQAILDGDPSVLVRAEALSCICRNFPDDAPNAIRRAFNSEEPLLMREALYLIGRYRLHRRCSHTLQKALKSKHPSVAALAKSILARLPEEERRRILSSSQDEPEDDEEGGDDGGSDRKSKP